MAVWRFFSQNDENKNLIQKVTNKVNVLPCLLAAFLACQLSFMAGISQGYSAILLAQLGSPDSLFPIDEEQSSWIASLGTACRPLGALMDGYMVDRLGRKGTMQSMSIMIFFSWLLTYFSRGIVMLYVSRMILGFALGMTGSVGLYIAEISLPIQRGTLGSLIEPFVGTGMLVVYVLGYLFAWRTVALVLFVYSGFVFVLMFFIPDSQLWHMAKGNKQKAMEALQWFRRDPNVVQSELREMEMKIGNFSRRLNYWESLRDASVRKTLVVFTVFIIFQQQVGYNIITSYAVDFFESLGSVYDENILSIIFGALSTIGSIVLMSIVHKFKRKTLIFVSGFGMACAMAGAATCMSIGSVTRTLPLLSIFVYVWFTKMGFISVPMLMIGEALPTRARGSVGAIFSTILYSVSFCSLKSYPFLSRVLGVNGLFWYFATASLVAAIFAQIFFPETKDKSLLDVDKEYKK